MTTPSTPQTSSGSSSSPPPPPQKTKKLSGKRKFLRLAGLMFVLCATLVYATPLLIKEGAVYWLERNGKTSVKIEKVLFNPFMGKVGLVGLDLDSDGSSLLSNKRFKVDISLDALLTKRIRIQDAVSDNLRIEVRQLADRQWQVASFTLPAQGPKEPKIEKKTSTPWNFVADNLQLTNCTLVLVTPEIDLTLELIEASVTDFTTVPGKNNTVIHIQSKINGAPLAIEISTLELQPDLRVEGHIDGKDLILADLARQLSPLLDSFSGFLNLQGDFSFTGKKAGKDKNTPLALQAVYNGSVRLNGVNISNKTFAYKGQSSWKGQVHWEMPSNAPMQLMTQGRLQAKGLEMQLPKAKITFREKALTLDGTVKVQAGPRLRVNSDTTFSLAETNLDMSTVKASDQGLRWKGKISVQKKEKNALFVNADGTLSGTKLDLHLPIQELRITEEELTLNGKTIIQAGGEIQVQNTSDLRLANTTVHLPTMHSSGRDLRWQGTLGQQAGKTNLEGKFNWENLTYATSAQEQKGKKAQEHDIFVEGNKLAWEGTVTNTTAVKDQGLTLQGSIQTGEVRVQTRQPALNLHNKQAKLQAQVGMIPEKGWTVNAGVKLQGTSLDQDAYAFSADAITWQGKVEQNETLTSRSDLSLEDLALQLRNKDKSPLLFLEGKKVTAQQAELNKNGTVSLKELIADQFKVVNAAKQEPFCRLEQGKVSGTQWRAEQGLQGKHIQLQGVHLVLNKDKKGQLNLPSTPSAQSTKKTSGKKKDKKKKEEKPPFGLAIDTIDVNGTLQYRDASLAKPFQSNLVLESLQIRNVNTQQTKENMKVALKAKIEDRAPLTIEADLRPFGKEFFLKGGLTLINYPLSRVSPYTIKSVGREMDKGQLRLQTKAEIKGEQVKIDNNVIIKNLATKAVSADLAGSLDGKLPLPLDTAISILKDNNDTINLDIPLSGSISSLRVGIADILTTALSKAIVPAASSYLLYAMGPYGALAYAGAKIGEELLTLKLAPVNFSKGSTELSQEMEKYLKQVAKILKERPEMEVSLCPTAATWELPGGYQKAPADKKTQILNELGQKRSEVVRAHLTSVYGISKGRLFICETKVVEKEKAALKVDLQL